MRSLCLSLIAVLAGCATTAGQFETSEIILPILNSPSSDEQSCKRAMAMSEGLLSEQECRAELPKAKELCGKAVNDYIGLYVTTEDESRYVARTIVLCKVWTLLGYETITTDRGVQYVVKPGGVLP